MNNDLQWPMFMNTCIYKNLYKKQCCYY